jgi:uncharacterized protein YlxW (UPF0749 family)
MARREDEPTGSVEPEPTPVTGTPADAPEPAVEQAEPDAAEAPAETDAALAVTQARPDAEQTEHRAASVEHDPPEAAKPAGSLGAWQRLSGAMRARGSRSHVLIGLLCAALGFALVVQVRQSGQDELASLRQDDLVRLLDEVTQRAEQLDDEVVRLQQSRDELASGTGRAQAAQELAQQRAAAEGILSGRLAAQGPGVEIQVVDPGNRLDASHLFNVLEELRNAGAEVVQVNGVRLVTSSAFVDGPEGIEVDGKRIESPYRWVAIGDPATMDRALEIPGGALATVRTQGATATTERSDQLTVDATRRLTEPRYATPQEDED